jgi:hypothetical protein
MNVRGLPWRARLVLLSVGAGVAAGACADRIEIGRDWPIGQSSAGSAGNVGSGAGAGGEAAACRVTSCQGKIYRCGDCVDNDGDGAIDAADAECTGACDDTEDSYFGGIPGQNNAPCRSDCYFDQDTGSGNDHCYWNQECDPLSVAPDYPPGGDARCAYDPTAKIAGTSASCAELAQTQEPECESVCGPLTPNGCDGFGCCELPAASGKFVWIGSSDRNVGTCNQDTLADPAACHPCTPVPSTFNACDPCEVCVGRPSPAASCSDALARCPRGEQACGQLGEAACAAEQYCVTGCCEAAPK